MVRLLLHCCISKYKFYEKTIYSLLKKTIGIERMEISSRLQELPLPACGGRISFIQYTCKNMIAGSGLADTTATVSCCWFDSFRIGSVGRVMPNLEIKIQENNEILLWGENSNKRLLSERSNDTSSVD